MTVWGIVAAAGRGTRFGGPKQFEVLGSKRVVDWAIEAARSVCDGVVLVIPPGCDEAGTARGPAVQIVPGAPTRSGSVRAGLAAVPDDAGVIVVHDAARPLADAATFRAVLTGLGSFDGVVPGCPLRDTLKRAKGGLVTTTLDREGLYSVQTPQAFLARALRDAHAGGADATDDAALVEARGGKIALIDGDPRNIKVTTQADLDLARALMRE